MAGDVFFETTPFSSLTREEMGQLYELYRSPGTPLTECLQEFMIYNTHASSLRQIEWSIARTVSAEWKILAYAKLFFKLVNQNQNSARLEVRINRGICTDKEIRQLLTLVMNRAINYNRTKITLTAPEDADQLMYLLPMGAERKSLVRLSRLILEEYDHTKHEEHLERLLKGNAGVGILSLEGECDASTIEKFARVKSLLSAAPKDGRRSETWNISPAWIRAEEDYRRKCGLRWLAKAAVLRETGRILGYSEYIVYPVTDNVAVEEEIAVDPEFQGIGIAKALRVAMLKDMALQGTVSNIFTYNAVTNAPIIHVNEILGFRKVCDYGKWEVDANVALSVL